MDTGIEKIEDNGILAQLRQQARKVYFLSFVYSVVLTVIVVLLPI
jgi:heme/copper-type cytochrome/quinol oxidase subunit 4